jgi:hypothetical protein
MKEAVLIPFDFIDALSYGPLAYYVHLLQIWLYRQRITGVRVIVLPEPNGTSEALSLGVASVTILKNASHMGLGVIRESVMQSCGLRKDLMLRQNSILEAVTFDNVFEKLQLHGTATVVSHFN